jgi:tetratricopeptide (TPR) repeat protein
MKTRLVWIVAVGALAALAGCSKDSTYNANVAKSEVPTLEQQTVPPGEVRASAEFLETGKRKWRVGDEKAARMCFQKAVEKNPYSFEAHYWLGVLTRDHHEWDAANQHFAHAVQYCPAGRWEARIRVDWGYLFEMQNQKGMAAKQYDLALLADPEFREAQGARQRVLPPVNANSDQ